MTPFKNILLVIGLTAVLAFGLSFVMPTPAPAQTTESCMTIEQNTSYIIEGQAKEVLVMTGEETVRFREFITKRYGMQPNDLLEFDTVQFIKVTYGTDSTDDDIMIVILYKGGCQVSYFMQAVGDYEADLDAFRGQLV